MDNITLAEYQAYWTGGRRAAIKASHNATTIQPLIDDLEAIKLDANYAGRSQENKDIIDYAIDELNAVKAEY